MQTGQRGASTQDGTKAREKDTKLQGANRGDRTQDHKATHESKFTESAAQLEEAICLKVESDFRMKRMRLRNSPLSVEMRTRLDENVRREYRPFSVMVRSKNIRVEEYLLPLIRERISLEAQLRRTQNRPFTAERIRSIKSEMEKLVLDEWPSIVNEGYADAVRHVHRIYPGSSSDYKIRELQESREDQCKERPEVLLKLIDDMLQSAMADSLLQNSG